MNWKRLIKLSIYGGLLGGAAMAFLSFRYRGVIFPYEGGVWPCYQNIRPFIFGAMVAFAEGLVDKSFKMLFLGPLITGLFVVIGHYVYQSIYNFVGEGMVVFWRPVLAMIFSLCLSVGSAVNKFIAFHQPIRRIIWHDALYATLISLMLILFAFLQHHLIYLFFGQYTPIAYHFIYGIGLGAGIYIAQNIRPTK